jgi:hypothetical protein
MKTAKVNPSALLKVAVDALKNLFVSNAADKVKASLLGKLAVQMQRNSMTLHRRANDAQDAVAAKKQLGDARYYCEKAAKAFALAAEAM